jgi:hypothetical protein
MAIEDETEDLGLISIQIGEELAYYSKEQIMLITEHQYVRKRPKP